MVFSTLKTATESINKIEKYINAVKAELTTIQFQFDSNFNHSGLHNIKDCVNDADYWIKDIREELNKQIEE